MNDATVLPRKPLIPKRSRKRLYSSRRASGLRLAVSHLCPSRHVCLPYCTRGSDLRAEEQQRNPARGVHLCTRSSRSQRRTATLASRTQPRLSRFVRCASTTSRCTSSASTRRSWPQQPRVPLWSPSWYIDAKITNAFHLARRQEALPQPVSLASAVEGFVRHCCAALPECAAE